MNARDLPCSRGNVVAAGTVLTSGPMSDRYGPPIPSVSGDGGGLPRGLSGVCALGTALMAPLAVDAQTLSLADAQSTVLSGLNQPNGVSMDRFGNFYIADTDNNRVVKISAGGG